MMFQAHIEQWIDFATTEIDQGIARWFYPRAGFMPYLPPVSLKHQTLAPYFFSSDCSSLSVLYALDVSLFRLRKLE